MKESGFAVKGKTVNGFVKDGGVTLNVQSPKAWQSTVGHEITHVLEGTETYGALREALYAYAESKGELANRRTALTELYNGMNADIDAELTADLVGEYLFTDKDFINKLTGNRPLFKKVWDEVKYLCKVATGKELTEIEKVEREFARAWKEQGQTQNKTNTTDNPDIQYSFSNSLLDNGTDLGYNLYTSSDNFILEVNKNDRAAFSRSLANKTADLGKDEIRTVEIYCANKIYYFEATGYMQGQMLYSANVNDFDEYKTVKKEFYDGYNGSRHTFGSWASILSPDGTGTRSDIRGTEDRRAESDVYEVYGEPRTRNGAGTQERIRQNFEDDPEEVESLVAELRKLYGLTENHLTKENETSSTDGVFFDGENTYIRYSLSKASPIINKLTGEEITERTFVTLQKLERGEDVALSELATLKEVKEGKLKKDALVEEFVAKHPELKDVPQKDVGTYLINSPEREQLRNFILEKRKKEGSFTGVDKNGKEVYNGSVEKGKRLDIVIGLPASGKSSAIVNPLSEYYKSVVVDSDIIKGELPEFNDGWGASLVHEESSIINAELFAVFLKTGSNIVLPIVGAKTSSVEQYLNHAKDYGYDVHLHLNELPGSKATGRNLSRYFETGRFIDPDTTAKYGNKPTEVYAEMKARGDISGYSRWNNDVERGKRPYLIEISEVNRAYGEFSDTWRASSGTNPEGSIGANTQGTNANSGNEMGRPQESVVENAPTRENSEGSTRLSGIFNLNPKTQEALSKSGVVSPELNDSSDDSIAFSDALQDISPTENFSLSNNGEQFAPIGNYSTPLNEAALEQDIAPVAENATTETVVENATTSESPMPTVPKSTRLQTIAQKVVENIRAVEADLADNRDLRREAEANYNNQIAKLQEQYNATKNKETKVAYNLLQSISRLERLKASTDAKFAKLISDLEARAEKMKDPTYSRALYKEAKMTEYAEWAENRIGDTNALCSLRLQRLVRLQYKSQ